MEPISLITGALLAGLKDVSTQAVKDAYAGLKSLIIKRFEASENPAGETALEKFEKKPEARQAALEDSLKKIQAQSDSEIIEAAKKLVELVAQAEKNKKVESTDKTIWTITIEGPSDNIDKAVIEAIHEFVRELSGDLKLTMERVTAASVKIYFEGSVKGFLTIKSLFENKKLSNILGFKVLAVEIDEPNEAVPALIEALKDEDNEVRRASAEALGDIGPEAKAAVPALIEAFKDLNNKVQNELERRVEERTTEILEEKHRELLRHKQDLDKANKDLMQTNKAFSVLARNIDKERNEAEKKIARTISAQILPLVDEIKNDKLPEQARAKFDVLTTYLNDLIPETTKGHDILVSLSAPELHVARMIKNGLPSEEIARRLRISLHTLETHRRNIRKKLNIENSGVNLSSYLQLKLGKIKPA